MANYDSQPNVVKQVQAAVNAAGYQPALVVDGAYGPKTKAGVIWFQRQHGLTQDGIIGDQTVAATIAPTPQAAANPIGNLQAQLSALQAGVPTPPPPIVSTPVADMINLQPLTLRFGQPAAAAASVGPAPAAGTAAAAVAAAKKTPIIPALAVAGLGAAVLWTVAKTAALATVGGVAGFAAGYALTYLPKLKSTFHGDTQFGVDYDLAFRDDFGLDYTSAFKTGFGIDYDAAFENQFGCEYGDNGLVAGDIGCEAPYSSLKA